MSQFGKAVADGLRDVKKYVAEQRDKPGFSDGTPAPPLSDRSVNETVTGEIDHLIDKHDSKKSFPSII